MQKKTGFSDDKSIGDENKEDEDNEDDGVWDTSDESSNDLANLGTLIRKQVQYLYQYIYINTILPQLKSIH
jgi:hypothetical protein